MINAMLFSLLSASGLLIGAVVGVFLKPGHKITASIMAFGSGALLSALAFELVEEAFKQGGFFPVVIGTIAGGAFFLLGNGVIDGFGGFLRHNSTKHRFVARQKHKYASSVIEHLSHVDILRKLPPDEIHRIVLFTEEIDFPDGFRIFEQGDEGDALYLIHSGEVEVVARVPDGGLMTIATLGAGQTLGEMSLLTQEARTGSAITRSRTKVYKIKKEDFDRLLAGSPRIATAMSQLVASRLVHTTAKHVETEYESKKWKKLALESADESSLAPIEERPIVEKHMSKAAALAIFLGALIDGVPESAVIGATMIGTAIPNIAFIVAVFISNFPEAVSSASGLIKNGFAKKTVFLLWTGLVALSGLTALLANLLLTGAPEWVIATANSIAAGGIIAMLSNTMMPEAFELGGTTVALSTIAGFLTSFLLSTL